MKILITGASGRLGREIVKALRDQHELVALSRTVSHTLGGVKSYAVDLTHLAQLSEIMATEKPDVIIHLAGLVTSENISDFYTLNSIGTLNLLEAISRYGKSGVHFIFPSATLSNSSSM